MSRKSAAAVSGAMLMLLAATAPMAAREASPGLAPVVATAPAWSAPVRVLNGFFREISEAIDSTNHVHIAAAGRGGLWYITDRGGAWNAKRILVNPHNKSYQEPSIALDDHDRVYIAFSRSSCNDCAPGSTDGIFTLTDKGRARGSFPSSPTRLAPAASAEPSLRVSGGHIYLAYQSDCCHPGPLPPLRFKTNVTGAWTTAQVAASGDGPSLRLGTDGRARVAYAKPHGIGFATASSASGGFASVALPGTGSGDFRALLALDLHDRPSVVWLHDGVSMNGIRYSSRGSSGWATPVEIAPTVGTIGYALDAQDRPHVVIGAGKVREERLVAGTWVASTVSSKGALDVAIRRAFDGHMVVAYSADPSGIYVSKN